MPIKFLKKERRDRGRSGQLSKDSLSYRTVIVYLIKKDKKCLTIRNKPDKLKKSPRAVDEKLTKKDKKTFDRKSRM
ncbi:hypothetical protein T23_07000 [Turicibacter faecis]|uniref:Uncharacterized protein n=1 Tax=Turicibacter faecis TaxID=2963365 RepID=A0ABN6ZFL8_9FIRM|nr:hypothetical protein T23_07000 [Turicibacter sp. TC023]